MTVLATLLYLMWSLLFPTSKYHASSILELSPRAPYHVLKYYVMGIGLMGKFP